MHNVIVKRNVQISISVGICSVLFYRCVSRVGGMNLSFVKGEASVACAALLVCELPNCVVVYADIKMVPLTAPYVPGR
jgi:deoxyinosine 3'endonuclease (endonuclease V)